VVFARWVERQASSDGEGLGALLVANPDLATELRALHADWDKVQALLDELGLTRSLGERLRRRYGSQADPGISLDGKGRSEKSGDFTSDVFRRLAGRRGEIGRYQIHGEIASGGQGAILRVWDEDLRRHLAMKVLLGRAEVGRSGETPPVDSRMLGRFLEEAQVTGQLDHPGIVPVHELGLDSAGRVYFTMKFVQGRTLQEVFEFVVEEREGWTRTRVLTVLLRVCEAMAYAHHKGVVHRDLKPANVMVGRFGEVFVMDWGLAKVLGRAETKDARLAPLPKTAALQSERQEADSGPDSPLLTMDGDVVGTPAYMAPEQAQGRVDAIGPHTDVYAVGAMLYHLLARQMPYCAPGTRITNRTILAMVLQGPPAALNSMQERIPAELEAICEKAMARDPRSRYCDTSALAEDLRAYIENRVVKAHRTGALVELKKWVERNKGLALASGAAVLALVAGIVTSLGYASRAKDAADRAEGLAKSEADARKEAQASATEAERLRDEATVRESEATERADALWTIEELKHFKMLDDDLEYARGQNRPTYISWLEKAHELIDGRPADPARNLRRVSSLQDHQRLLDYIRGLALPPSEADLAADRASHPKAKELESKRAELLWLSRVLGLEPWLSDPEFEANLASMVSGAPDMIGEARNLVDPDSRVSGQELKALALARRAVELIRGEDRSMYVDTLAWALLWAGRFDEAISLERGVVEDVAQVRRAEFESNLRRMESIVLPFRDGSAASRRVVLSAEVAVLEEEVAKRRTYRFDDRENEWWNTNLAELIQDLEELREPIALVERSVSSPEAVASWSEAIEAIARSEKYGGLRLTPQIELFPLGPDPDSGLWEFAHLGTGEPAVRGSDGKLTLRSEAGMVFVLLPRGRLPAKEGNPPTVMAQRFIVQPRVAPNDVLLDAFFLSKYEMTLAQWLRNSHWMGQAGRDEPLLPAYGVSWEDCVGTLERAGLFLRLPTEAEWEYGCRAGTTTPWWTGENEFTLEGAANIDFKDPDAKTRPKLQPIGQLLANPFGLHDVHGNVWEWCHDEFVVPQFGESKATGSGTHLLRGGGYSAEAAVAHSAFRYLSLPGNRNAIFGLRVARRVTP
jgi:serine/threonine protein kinase/formylglycine-generating enzyme required for sulfatase activity